MLNICENMMCCGCSACMTACPCDAIKMHKNQKGFYRPTINLDLCINCGQCDEVCDLKKREIGEVTIHRTVAAKNSNLDLRKRSSSGGAFIAFCESVLKYEGSVVYGAVMDETSVVRHCRAESIEECHKMQGSKYVQSYTVGIYDQVIDDLIMGRRVLFSGTPCQCGTLRRLVKVKKINASNLFLIDIICHGTPSPDIFAKYINYVKKKKKNFEKFEIRSSFADWGQYCSAIYYNGKVDSTSHLSQAYIKLFCTDACLNDSCYKCPYCTLNRPGDVTIGDFWGIEKYYPEFVDKDGVSVIISNTKAGEKMLKWINPYMLIMESSEIDCMDNQLNLKQPTVPGRNPEEFWNDFLKKDFRFILKKYAGIMIIRKVKNFVKRSLIRVRAK